jgi:hypothetical protein
MRIVGLSGTEELSPATAALGWTIVIGSAAAIFVATLLLRPRRA